MAAGWSRYEIYNPMLHKIAEIEVAGIRSWTLNCYPDVGRLQFWLPVFGVDGKVFPKTTLTNLNAGNIVVVTHTPSKNSDGSFNGVLPQWVGHIQPPQEWNYGKLQVTAYAAEDILAYRPMPLVTLSGTPGSIFAQILGLANDQGGTPIQPGSIDLGGYNISMDVSLSALEEIKRLSAGMGNDFDITASVDTSGNLVLLGNWYPSKGVSTGVLLNNKNSELKSPQYTEQGRFYNKVIGFSDADSHGNRVSATAIDNNSPTTALLAINVVFQGTKKVAQVQSMANAYLASHRLPLRTFSPTILDRGNIFSALQVGNALAFSNSYVGFSAGGVGFSGSIRITAMEYGELRNKVSLAGVVL